MRMEKFHLARTSTAQFWPYKAAVSLKWSSSGHGSLQSLLPNCFDLDSRWVVLVHLCQQVPLYAWAGFHPVSLSLDPILSVFMWPSLCPNSLSICSPSLSISLTPSLSTPGDHSLFLPSCILPCTPGYLKTSVRRSDRNRNVLLDMMIPNAISEMSRKGFPACPSQTACPWILRDPNCHSEICHREIPMYPLVSKLQSGHRIIES